MIEDGGYDDDPLPRFIFLKHPSEMSGQAGIIFRA